LMLSTRRFMRGATTIASFMSTALNATSVSGLLFHFCWVLVVFWEWKKKMPVSPAVTFSQVVHPMGVAYDSSANTAWRLHSLRQSSIQCASSSWAERRL
jgi:hypothetical protein